MRTFGVLKDLSSSVVRGTSVDVGLRSTTHGTSESGVKGISSFYREPKDFESFIGRDLVR